MGSALRRLCLLLGGFSSRRDRLLCCCCDGLRYRFSGGCRLLLCCCGKLGQNILLGELDAAVLLHFKRAAIDGIIGIAFGGVEIHDDDEIRVAVVGAETETVFQCGKIAKDGLVGMRDGEFTVGGEQVLLAGIVGERGDVVCSLLGYHAGQCEALSDGCGCGGCCFV